MQVISHGKRPSKVGLYEHDLSVYIQTIRKLFTKTSL